MKDSVRRVKGDPSSVGQYIFNILLLFVNSVGIIGAMAQVLELPWQQLPKSDTPTGEDSLAGVVFWCGIFLFCMIAGLLRKKADRKQTLKQVIICVSAYILCGLLLRNVLLEGLAAALENAVGNLNQRYQLHIDLTSGTWLPDVAEWTENVKSWCVTMSVLYLFLPLVLSGGFLGRRFRGIWLLAGNTLWFYAACVCDRFPDTFFLTVCILGIVAALIQQNFEKNPGAGLWAVLCTVIVTGGFMAVSFRFLMPVLDIQYEASREERVQFYKFVNGDWLPVMKRALSRLGFGPGVDVTGSLNRTKAFENTSTPIYRVTADRVPQGTLYLKGFVGKDYGGKAWAAAKDKTLAEYYKEHSMELPEDYRDLVNITYEAGRALGKNAAPRHISIEELGGKGSYSLYPSGALLTEEFKVHSDGSVARRGSQYEFSYYYLSGSHTGSTLSGKWAQIESQYAQYVYDNFLEYDEESLPKLTEMLKQEKIRTDSIYNCALDIISFVQRQASYNLDAGRNPAGTDFVEYFLFDSHEGYCVHFASAGVLAFRYFGIPARYVTGYAVSRSDFSRNSEGSYSAEVTGKMAHAWVEIYLDKIGWVPVEMTPGTAALSESSGMEQLDYVGQMAGQSMIPADNTSRREESTVPSGEEPKEDSETKDWSEFENWMTSAVTPDLGKMPETDKDKGKQETNKDEGKPETDKDEGKQEENKDGSKPETDKAGEKPGANKDNSKPEADNAGRKPETSGKGEKLPSISSGGEPGTGNIQEGEVGTDQPFEEERWDFTPFLQALYWLLRILCYCLGCGALVTAAVKIYQAKRRRKYRLFRSLGTGERIFWLYRNLRRTLRFAGCPRDLDVDGEAFWQKLTVISRQVSREEYDAFCLVLEKNSFAEKEPSHEEFMAVNALHDRLVKGIYDRAPFYKKVLIGRYWDMCKEGA